MPTRPCPKTTSKVPPLRHGVEPVDQPADAVRPSAPQAGRVDTKALLN